MASRLNVAFILRPGQGKCKRNSGENVIQSYYIADIKKYFFY